MQIRFWNLNLLLCNIENPWAKCSSFVFWPHNHHLWQTVRAHCLLPWYFAFIAKLLKLIPFNNVLRFKNLTLKGQPWPDFMSQPKSVWFVTVMISTTSNKIQKRFAKCKTSTVLENKHFFSIWAELWGQTFFPPLFKICSGELTLAKDIATNTIWHAELRHGGKLMKWIENAKGIVYVLNKTQKKWKHNSPLVISTVSWSMATSCLLNLKLHCRWF